MIKAIETLYKGYRFRSRLEARWAVFFDALGIDWEYEPEGFEMADGTRYLPDFYLPTFSGGMWCEVKPNGGDFVKARKFSLEARVPIWLCEGEPTTREYWIEGCNLPNDESTEPWGCEGIPCFDQATSENRMFWQPGYCDEDGTIPQDMLYQGQSKLEKAVLAARQARFEFGANELGMEHKHAKSNPQGHDLHQRKYPDVGPEF